MDELKTIASSPDLVYSAENFEVLKAIQKEVSSTACEAAEAMPSYKEGCSGTCASNLKCTESGTEEICLCDPTHYWDDNSKSCVAIRCLSGENVCVGKPNGDFPACYPECGSGFFYNCYNGNTAIGQCAYGQLEISLHPGQDSTDLPGVSSTERCNRLAAFCPQN